MAFTAGFPKYNLGNWSSRGRVELKHSTLNMHICSKVFALVQMIEKWHVKWVNRDKVHTHPAKCVRSIICSAADVCRCCLQSLPFFSGIYRIKANPSTVNFKWVYSNNRRASIIYKALLCVCKFRWPSPWQQLAEFYQCPEVLASFTKLLPTSLSPQRPALHFRSLWNGFVH